MLARGVPASNAAIQAARERYQKDTRIEIDEDARELDGPDTMDDPTPGRWIEAWVWVPESEIDDQSD